MCKTFRVIQALKQVSGWTWNDSTGCSITVDNLASWEAYVEKHPGAKPFKNKGWKHLHVMSQIMPAVLTGAHVFSASHGTIGIGEARVPASQVMPEQDWEGSPTHWSDSGFHDDSQASHVFFKLKLFLC